MPRLIYTIDYTKSALDIAAQALVVARVQAYASEKGLVIEERGRGNQRQWLLIMPIDELNSVLDELLFAGLLLPLQEIRSRPDAHVVLHERFSTLTWVDDPE